MRNRGLFSHVAEKVELGSLQSCTAREQETMVMRDYGYELEEDRFRSEVRRSLFLMMTVKPWHREVVEFPSLKIFNSKKDKSLINVI